MSLSGSRESILVGHPLDCSRNRHHASGTVNSQECPLSPQFGSQVASGKCGDLRGIQGATGTVFHCKPLT